MKDDAEIEETLVRLVQSKEILVKTEHGKDYYSLSEKGFADAEKLLRENEDAQLFLFTVFFRINDLKKGHLKKDKFTVLKEAIQYITEKFNPNFLNVLTKACRDGTIQGLKLKETVRV
jgi:DNA-binding PadR family transcriptional regulator